MAWKPGGGSSWEVSAINWSSKAAEIHDDSSCRPKWRETANKCLCVHVGACMCVCVSAVGMLLCKCVSMWKRATVTNVFVSMCAHVQVHVRVCVWVCALTEEMRNWGQRESRPTLRDSCSFVNVKQPAFNTDPTSSFSCSDWPPWPCVFVCICVCVCACTRYLDANQPQRHYWLRCTLLTFPTCLLVLVISLPPSRLELITTAFQWKWGGAPRGKVRRDRMKERKRGDEGTRRWGNEEMGEGGMKSHDGLCSASWGLQQHPLVQWKGAFLKYTPALFKMKYLTLERKQTLAFVRWLWYVA